MSALALAGRGVVALPQGAARSGRLSWVLTVEAERIWRWSSRDIILQIGGDTTECASGLAVDDIVESLDDAGGSQVVAMPLQDGMDLALLLRVIRVAWVDLALVMVDEEGVAEWEGRLSIVGGRVGDVELHPEEAICSLRIAPLDQIDTADLVPESVAVEDRTWPLAAESARGLKPPLVYGRPGSYAYETVTDTDSTPTYDYSYYAWALGNNVTWQQVRQTRTAGVTPALGVERESVAVNMYPYNDDAPLTETLSVNAQWLAITLGHAPATEVELWAGVEQAGPSQGKWVTTTLPTTHGFDGLGRHVMLIDISAEPTYIKHSSTWLIAWTELGGLAGPPGCERGSLGAVTVAMLQRSSAPIDWPSVLRAAAFLDRYAIGGYVDDSMTPTEWAKTRLTAFGAAIRWGRGGVGIVVQDPTSPPVATISLDTDGHLDGPVLLARPEADEVVVSWANTATSVGRQARSRIVRTGAPPPPFPKVQIVAAAEVWDSTTAILIGEMHLRRLGARTEITILVDMSTWWWLRHGDVVDITYELLGWVAGSASRWVVQQAQHTDGVPLVEGEAETTHRKLRLRRREVERLRSYATAESSKGQ